MRPPRLRARNYVVYYGYGPLPQIAEFDLAVLEPAGWTGPDLEGLGRGAVRRIAYLSAMEAPSWLVADIGLQPRDFLQVDGEPWHRPEFDTYVVDPRARIWKQYLHRRLREIAATPWEGVFLDGLGDVEDPVMAAQSGWLIPAAADIVRMARDLMKDRLVL